MSMRFARLIVKGERQSLSFIAQPAASISAEVRQRRSMPCRPVLCLSNSLVVLNSLAHAVHVERHWWSICFFICGSGFKKEPAYTRELGAAGVTELKKCNAL